MKKLFEKYNGRRWLRALTLPNNDDDFPDNDDDNADQTTLFFPKGVSTPYQSHFREEMEMKEIHKKSGRPETSYAETSFGGDEDLDRKLAILRRDALTGMINTTNIPDVYRLDPEQQEKEIKRVKDFIKTRYPNADLSKLVIGFSSETKIIKDNGSDFEKNFLNLTYVKRALGESYEEFAKKQEQRIYEERKMLTEVVRKSPEKREIIDSLKEKILKKETEKKKKKESFMKRNKQKKSKSEKRKLKNKMKKMKKS